MRQLGKEIGWTAGTAKKTIVLIRLAVGDQQLAQRGVNVIVSAPHFLFR